MFYVCCIRCGSGLSLLSQSIIASSYWWSTTKGQQREVFFSVPDPWHFWCWSGSADPCLWLMDPDPPIFVIDFQDANKKLIFKKRFSAYYFLKVHIHHFSKIKSPKEVTKQYESRFFLTIFAWWQKDPGGPKTCGSGTLVFSYYSISNLVSRVRVVFSYFSISNLVSRVRIWTFFIHKFISFLSFFDRKT